MRGPPTGEAGLRGGAWVPRTLRGRGPGDAPGWCQDLGEGTSHSTSWTPCCRGGKRMTPHPRPALALPLPSARGHPELHKPAPGCLFVRTAAEEGSEGAQPEALRCLFFYFFAFGRENSVRFCPIYVSTREQTLVVCVRVFLCWFFFFFFKETVKKTPPFLCFLPPPSPFFRQTPFHLSSPPFLLWVPPPFRFCFATSLHSCL